MVQTIRYHHGPISFVKQGLMKELGRVLRGLSRQHLMLF